jgi:hypothetical protein
MKRGSNPRRGHTPPVPLALTGWPSVAGPTRSSYASAQNSGVDASAPIGCRSPFHAVLLGARRSLGHAQVLVRHAWPRAQVQVAKNKPHAIVWRREPPTASETYQNACVSWNLSVAVRMSLMLVLLGVNHEVRRARRSPCSTAFGAESFVYAPLSTRRIFDCHMWLASYPPAMMPPHQRSRFERCLAPNHVEPKLCVVERGARTRFADAFLKICRVLTSIGLIHPSLQCPHSTDIVHRYAWRLATHDVHMTRLLQGRGAR